jgi:uncharacterized membrane protein
VFFHVYRDILMRRALEAVSLVALAILLAETLRAFYGSPPLPARIPTHFNAAGNPDAWGPTPMLWLLPAIAAALYLLITWVARYPAAFNFPVRVTPFNRRRLETIALNMIAWIKAELLAFFALIQWTMIGAARSSGRSISILPMSLLLAVVFLTMGLHIAAFFRAGRIRPG